MAQENKADEDPFTTHSISPKDQNLLIGAAARNKDNEMDIVLDTNYSTLQPLERIAVKNHAAQQARAQAPTSGSGGITVSPNSRQARGRGQVQRRSTPGAATPTPQPPILSTTVGHRNRNQGPSFSSVVKLDHQSTGVIRMKIFTIILCVVSIVMGSIELARLYKPRVESLPWNIAMVSIITFISFMFWFFAVLVPNAAANGSKWAASKPMENISTFIVVYSVKFWRDCVVRDSDGKYTCCPIVYPSNSDVYGATCCIGSKIHPAKWLYFEICLRRWIMNSLLVINFWNTSLFYGFESTLIVTISVVIELYIAFHEMCLAKEVEDTPTGPPIKFTWFGGRSVSRVTYDPFNSTYRNIFRNARGDSPIDDDEEQLASAIVTSGTDNNMNINNTSSKPIVNNMENDNKDQTSGDDGEQNDASAGEQV